MTGSYFVLDFLRPLQIFVSWLDSPQLYAVGSQSALRYKSVFVNLARQVEICFLVHFFKLQGLEHFFRLCVVHLKWRRLIDILLKSKLEVMQTKRARYNEELCLFLCSWCGQQRCCSLAASETYLSRMLGHQDHRWSFASFGASLFAFKRASCSDADLDRLARLETSLCLLLRSLAFYCPAWNWSFMYLVWFHSLPTSSKSNFWRLI